ncbi:MCE family protein [Actinocorallia populi]|uniref:MCE family protein n=1 Tax=Actinocorallia populi TaxID=2079200 RepID=UPI000D0911F0|nr:MCE family protein [Actinocorallia populi]
MRRPLSALLALSLTAALGGCSAVGGSGTYTLTAYFTKTPSLYEKSRVKVMGANVGTIDKIEVDQATQKVKVTLSVRGDVPVPADANAAVVSANTIGERNIVLYPAWKPGMQKIKPGTVIPEERTDLPVEIDDALDAFTTLAQSIDPEKLGSTFRGGADMLRDNGEDINGALQTVGDLTGDLAAQDERIISLATSLNELAGSLNERDDKLKALFKAFNDAGGMLADERNQLRGFLAGLEAVIRQGDVIVEVYHEKLPSTVTDLSEIVMTMKANSGSVGQAIEGMARLTQAVTKAYDPKRKLVTIRLQLSAITRAWLQPIFTAAGWGELPCLDQPFGNCDDTITKKAKKKKKAGGS